MNKIEFKDFKVIKELHQEDLEKTINKYLRDGYILIGGTSCFYAYDRVWYIQSIAKKVNLKIFKNDEYEIWYDNEELIKTGYKTFNEYILDKNETRFKKNIILKIIKDNQELPIDKLK